MRRKAVTLAEVLVVVVVMGVIASVGYVSYHGMIEKRLDEEAKAAIRSIALAELSYFSENNSFYPSPQGMVNNEVTIMKNLDVDFYTDDWEFCINSILQLGSMKRAVIIAKRIGSDKAFGIRVWEEGPFEEFEQDNGWGDYNCGTGN